MINLMFWILCTLGITEKIIIITRVTILSCLVFSQLASLPSPSALQSICCFTSSDSALWRWCRSHVEMVKRDSKWPLNTFGATSNATAFPSKLNTPSGFSFSSLGCDCFSSGRSLTVDGCMPINAHIHIIFNALPKVIYSISCSWTHAQLFIRTHEEHLHR